MVKVQILESEKKFWDGLVYALSTSKSKYLVGILNAATFIMIGLDNSRDTMYDLEQKAIEIYELDEQGLKDTRKIITRYSIHASEYNEYLVDNGVYLNSKFNGKGTK